MYIEFIKEIAQKERKGFSEDLTNLIEEEEKYSDE